MDADEGEDAEGDSSAEEPEHAGGGTTDRLWVQHFVGECDPYATFIRERQALHPCGRLRDELIQNPTQSSPGKPWCPSLVSSIFSLQIWCSL